MRIQGKNIVLILCSVFLALILFEFLSRSFLPIEARLYGQYNKDVVRQPKPYVMFGGSPGGVYEGETLNSLGYRGSLPDMPKPAGEYRILLLGGSTVFEGAPTMATLLEKAFAQGERTDVRCYNFGVVSSVSGQDLARLVFEAVDYDPDLLIMFNGGNDLFSPLVLDPRPGYPFNFLLYENNPLLYNDIAEYPTLTLLAFGSNLMRILAPAYFKERLVRLNRLREEVGFLSATWKEAVVRIYVNHLGKAHHISRAFGAEFIAIFQPAIYFKEVLAEEEQARFQHNNPALYREFTSTKDYALSMRAGVLKTIQMIQGKQDLKFVDLSDLFKNNPQDVFKDYIHVYQEYNNDIVKAMYQALQDNFPQLETIDVN